MAIVSDTLTLMPISGGQTAAAALTAINTNFLETAAAVNALANTIADMSSKNAIIRQSVVLGPDVMVGDLVYWNTTNSRYEKAQALLRAVPGMQGQTLEADCAHVDGVVIKKVAANDNETTGLGTLLCGGCWTDTAVSSRFLGLTQENQTASAGVYYLSPEHPGQVTSDPGGNLRQPVLVYYGDGTFNLGLFYMAHDNHFHTYVEPDATSDWAAITEPASYPTGATYKLNDMLPIAGGTTYIGGIGADTAAVFALPVSGGSALDTTPALQTLTKGLTTSTHFTVASGALVTNLTAANLAAADVKVFNHFPFAYGSPVVRYVSSTDESSLSVSTINGIVTLTPNAFTLVPGAATGSTFVGITGGTIYTAPVVNAIEAGPGITVESGTTAGSVVVANNSIYGQLVEPDTINHNGTTVGTDGTKQYVTFPALRSGAYMLLQKNVTGVVSGAQLFIGASVIGSANVAADVVLTAIQQPTTGSPVTATGTSLGTVQLTLSGTDSKITYAETATGVAITSDNNWTGTLIAKVTPTAAPSVDLNLLRIGFVIKKPTA